MMKILLNLFIAFSLLIVNCQASTVNGLKDLVDDLNYSLTVEWDQKDQNFYNSKLNQFYNDLNSHQVSNEEIKSFLKNEIKDQKLANDLSNLNVVDAQAMLKQYMNKTYSSGASFAGEATYTWIGLVLVLILVAAVINHDHSVPSKGHYSCQKENGQLGTFYGENPGSFGPCP